MMFSRVRVLGMLLANRKSGEGGTYEQNMDVLLHR